MARKPKPAPIYEKCHDAHRLQFCYKGKQYRQGYISNQHDAYLLQDEVNRLVRAYKDGVLKPPEGMHLPNFIFGTARKNFGEIYPEEIPSVVRISELIEIFLNFSYTHFAKNTCDTIKIHINHLKKFLEHYGSYALALNKVNTGLFYDYMDERLKKGIRKDTINRELTTFQKMFALACEYKMVKENVVKTVKRFCSDPKPQFRTLIEAERILKKEIYTTQKAKAIKRFRILDDKEIREFICLAEGTWLHPILQTFAYTGARKCELIKMQWIDIDFENALLDLRSNKQIKNEMETIRKIPMHEKLRPVLLEQHAKTGNQQWVFPGPKFGKNLNRGSLGNAVRKLVKGTKFEGLACHAFRYSFGSILANRGVDSRHIAIFMGHRTEIMKQKYQRVFAERTRELINNIDYDI